jgi:hypothetical protein
MSTPKNSSGPCTWKIEDWADGRKLYISGTCRTFKESKGLLNRINRAMKKAYKLGVLHGKSSTHARQLSTKIPVIYSHTWPAKESAE